MASLATRMTTGAPKIVTCHVYPPIPIRSHDWCAHYDGYEEHGPYGWGTTKTEAISDLIDNYDAPGCEAEAA